MEVLIIPIAVCLPHKPSDFIVESFHGGVGEAASAPEGGYALQMFPTVSAMETSSSVPVSLAIEHQFLNAASA